MSVGPGRYDDLCTAARENAMAEGALLIVFNGKFGDGFSAQLSPGLLLGVPAILRDVAQQIETSFAKGDA